MIVGVQDDLSVHKSKEKYSVLNTNERIEFIKDLCFVDRVISYKNTDQTNLLHELNIFVIDPEFGYTSQHINTINYCKKNNIKIITVEGISTTQIIIKILNK